MCTLVYQSFCAEMRKLAASKHTMRVPQSREGIRPIRAETLLQRDRAGSLLKNWHDHIPGGLADKRTPQDFKERSLQQGVKVEMEHTNNPAVATEIAMDHMTEDPKYYPKLKKMEEGDKTAGLKELLTTPIPRTRDWFIRTGANALQGAGRVTGKAPIQAMKPPVSSLTPRASGTMRAAKGISSISEDELNRLGFGDLLKSGAASTPFEEFKKKLKAGDIILTKAHKPGVFGRLASAVQGTPYGHAALYIGDGTVIDTRVGQGVLQRPLAGLTSKGGSPSDLRAYRPRATLEERKKAVDIAKEYVGTPYSLLGAARLLLPAAKRGAGTSKDKPPAVICSQLVVNAYPKLNFAAGKHRPHVLPVDLSKSPLTKFVAEHRIEKKAYKLQGHLSFQGVPVSIENRKGSVRKGEDSDGKPWRTVFKIPYGYLTGTKGNDGEAIDVYVGPDKTSANVYVIHQRKLGGKGYDEDKVMLGFATEDDAKAAYLQHYDDKGPELLGPITTMSVKDLRDRLHSSKTHRKLASAKTSAVDLSNPLNTDVPEGALPIRPSAVPDRDLPKPTNKLAWDGTGSAVGPTGTPIPYIDRDEKPDRAKPGDVPSRDGTNPGAVKVERHLTGADSATTLPTSAAVTGSDTGATTRV